MNKLGTNGNQENLKLMTNDEAERSLHDALCVVRSLVKKRSLVPGGAAVEMGLRTTPRRSERNLQN